MTPEQLRQRRRERDLKLKESRRAGDIIYINPRMPEIDLSLYAGKYGGYLPDDAPTTWQRIKRFFIRG